MIITIDAGNSLAKWKAWQHGDIVSRGVIDYANLQQGIELLPEEEFTEIFLAEVGGSNLSHYLKQRFGDGRVRNVQSEAQCLGIINCYQEPWRLGIDRLLAMAEAYHDAGCKACCIIDLGTAATIDVVDDAGVHLGGHIVPGLTMLRHSLSVHTDKVRFELQQSLQLGLGQSTQSAVENGTWSMLLAWIEQEALRFNQSFPEGRIYLSGGLAAVAAESLTIGNVIVHEDLVLDALKRLALHS